MGTPAPGVGELPEGTVTVLFTDVPDSTRLAEQRGDRYARDRIHACEELAREQLVAHGGIEVKTTGDGLMIAFTSARRAVECAVAIQRAVAEQNRAAPANALWLRIGINTGEVLHKDADLFGVSVNAAKRIEGRAPAGGIFVSAQVHALVGATQFDFHDRGLFELRGFEAPWQLYEVNWRTPRAEPLRPLVGRERELTALFDAVDDLIEGPGRVVLISGEPGVGKTRLAAELASYAQSRGLGVLTGRCREGAPTPAYWPWIEIGGAWAETHELERLRAITPKQVMVLRRMFPALATLLPAEDADGQGEHEEPEPQQLELFDAYTQYLRSASADRPMLVVLDDLHWADGASLRLFEFIAEEIDSIPVLLVGLYRDTEPARGDESSARRFPPRAQGALRVPLGGLDRAQTGELVVAMGGELTDRAIDQIHRRTAGNPLLATELTRWAIERGTDELPHDVTDIVHSRLRSLPQPAEEVLLLAAVAGEEFAFETLSAVGPWSEAEVVAVLDAAIRARLLVELEQPGRYRFLHGLLRDALLAEVSATRRAAIHADVARSLERRWGAGARDRAPRLAHHFLEAAGLSAENAQRAAEYTMLAAEQSEHTYAWSEAARWYRAALSVASAHDDATRARLEFGLGRALQLSGDGRGAWAALMRAADLARAIEDDVLFAEVAVVAAEVMAPRERVEPLIDDALAALGDREPYLRARLLMFGGGIHAPAPAAPQRLNQVRRIAASHRYADVSLWVDVQDACVAEQEGRWEDAITMRRQIVSRYRLASDSGLAAAVGFLGDLPAYRDESTRFLEDARRRHDRVSEAYALAYLADVAWLRGELPQLAELVREMPAASYARAIGRGRLALAEGRVADALHAVATFDPRTAGPIEHVSSLLGFRARVVHCAGEPPAAVERALADWREAYAAADVGSVNRLAGAVLAADAVAAAGDEHEAHELYEYLTRDAWSSFRYVFFADSIDEARGALAARIGRTDAARAHYLAGLTWAEDRASPLPALQCLHGLRHLERSAPPDREGDPVTADAGTLQARLAATGFAPGAAERLLHPSA